MARDGIEKGYNRDRTYKSGENKFSTVVCLYWRALMIKNNMTQHSATNLLRDLRTKEPKNICGLLLNWRNVRASIHVREMHKFLLIDGPITKFALLISVSIVLCWIWQRGQILNKKLKRKIIKSSISMSSQALFHDYHRWLYINYSLVLWDQTMPTVEIQSLCQSPHISSYWRRVRNIWASQVIK